MQPRCSFPLAADLGCNPHHAIEKRCINARPLTGRWPVPRVFRNALLLRSSFDPNKLHMTSVKAAPNIHSNTAPGPSSQPFASSFPLPIFHQKLLMWCGRGWGKRELCRKQGRATCGFQLLSFRKMQNAHLLSFQIPIVLRQAAVEDSLTTSSRASPFRQSLSRSRWHTSAYHLGRSAGGCMKPREILVPNETRCGVHR